MSYNLQLSTDEAVVKKACEKYGITTEQFSVLKTRSTDAKATAYCPYSRFRVGASILTNDGQYIDGANVENASYPVGTCAERVAYGKAVTEGHKKFKALAVATDISPPASPCGMCRQFIREFCEPDFPVFMFDKDGAFEVMTLGELLPLSFGPSALPRHDA
ncbi:cytidine deaminase-like protein [Xylogone sp. PMI_703]|nr:cytidine deaminase-like protein [Xylogone sp. PMI_703]